MSALANPSMADVVITELLDGETLPSDATLLMSAVETKTTTYLDVEYEYYILRINKGQALNRLDFVIKYESSIQDLLWMVLILMGLQSLSILIWSV